MKLSRLTILPVLLLLLLPCAVCWAQGENLDSIPRGTYLMFEGPVRMSGSTPLSLADLPQGEYSIRVEGPGLAASRARLLRDDRGLSFGSWSGPGALLQPPGFAQLRRGERRGWYHLGAAAVSGFSWWLNNDQAKDAPVGSAENSDEKRIRDIWIGYFAATWLSAGLESWLLTPEPTFTDNGPSGYLATFPRVGKWNAALRSALVPGSGQYYLGNGTRATNFSAIVAAAAAGAIIAQDFYLDARRDFDAAQRKLDLAGTPEEALLAQAQLDDAESSKDANSVVRWVFIGTAAYVYGWNILDAYNGAQRAQSSLPVLSVAPTPSGMFLTASFGFH